VDIVCPPFRPQTQRELEADAGRIGAAGPDLVLVALGCPRQERFIAQHFVAAPRAVWIGVGGTFDFYAGKRRRAPRVLQAVGAEWLARLAQEPRRLWRRYLVHDLPGLIGTAPALIRRRRRADPGEVEELRRVLTGAA
jgi:N-acetylglucosaminyldiphosphoundecaprenol N-acetyl-beta-D-mannosaminyltransferase